ncbi:MAG TPA: hypothetical protein VK473_11905 [Terriglobales bacterium]|nr:hypothetical protein [Terriglobales bacterium]
MAAGDPQCGRERAVWTTVILAAGLLIATAIWGVAARAAKMKAGTAAAESGQFGSLAPGSKVKVVVAVESVSPEGLIHGEVLDKKSEEDYVHSRKAVNIRSDAATTFVMGKQSDLRPAAVVHVSGKLLEDRSLRAEQIVILTGYVQVQER